VATGVDVKILGGHHVGIAVVPGQQRVDRPHHRPAAGDGQRPALAEVVLYVDDDQRPHLVTVSAPSPVYHGCRSPDLAAMGAAVQ
jgi:hypothetical protein